MPAVPPTTSRKRPVNLTLSDEVVKSAKRYSGNLSATVDLLLVQYVQQQELARQDQATKARASASEWNAVHEAVGSFADEHSTL